MTQQHIDLIETNFRSCGQYIQSALAQCGPALAAAMEKSISVVESGGTLFFAGNGGSAADCSHVVGELVGAFETCRTPLPAIALTTDTTVLTSVANDFFFDRVFIQQAEALVRPGDMLWLVSTSGESANLLLVASWAKDKGIATAGLTGKSGGGLALAVDYPIVAPGDNTQRIQEVHILMLHTLASALKHRFADGI